MSNDKDIKLVGAFIGRLLVGIAEQKTLSVGLSDLPVMQAIKRIQTADYPSVLRAVVAHPGVGEFLMQAVAEQDDIKEAEEASVRKD